MSIPYHKAKSDVLKSDIRKKTGIKIIDIHLKCGVWMALLNVKPDGQAEWERVTDLLSKPRFNIKVDKLDKTGATSLYLI